MTGGLFRRLERKLGELVRNRGLRGAAAGPRRHVQPPAVSMDTVLFAIPTLFNRPMRTIACIDHLHRQIAASGANHRIAVVINEMTGEFDRHDFRYPNVEKHCGNLKYSVSRALNTAIEARRGDEKYFCYVDEGVRAKRDDWFSRLIGLYTEFDDVGAIGFRKHSTFRTWHKVIREGLYEVLWSDGFLLVDFDRFDRVGRFDEAFLADKEVQDFCYRLHDAGFRNLCVAESVWHDQEAFPRKVKRDRSRFLSLVVRSRAIFAARWRQWEVDRALSP